MHIGQGRIMSETLTNSGPLEADTAQAAENAVTLEGSAEIALPAVTTQVEQPAAAILPASDAQEAVSLKEEEDRAEIVGEERISLSENGEESSENNAEVYEAVPESATPVDTPPLE